MTPEQLEICTHLGLVTYQPGSFDKRFGNSLSSIALNSPDKELSEKQNEWMYRLLYKYRKQLPYVYSKHDAHPLCNKKERLK